MSCCCTRKIINGHETILTRLIRTLRFDRIRLDLETRSTLYSQTISRAPWSGVVAWLWSPELPRVADSAHMPLQECGNSSGLVESQPRSSTVVKKGFWSCIGSLGYGSLSALKKARVWGYFTPTHMPTPCQKSSHSHMRWNRMYLHFVGTHNTWPSKKTLSSDQGSWDCSLSNWAFGFLSHKRLISMRSSYHIIQLSRLSRLFILPSSMLRAPWIHIYPHWSNTQASQSIEDSETTPGTLTFRGTSSKTRSGYSCLGYLSVGNLFSRKAFNLTQGSLYTETVCCVRLLGFAGAVLTRFKKLVVVDTRGAPPGVPCGLCDCDMVDTNLRCYVLKSDDGKTKGRWS